MVSCPSRTGTVAGAVSGLGGENVRAAPQSVNGF